MALTSLQGIGICATLYVFWRGIIRPLVVKSPLDELPGPPAQSSITGNLARYLSRDAEDFHLEVAQNYGPVVNMKGFFGSPVLYVYDPKALHSIMVKDQYNYEETPMFISLTRLLFGPGLLASLGDFHKKQRKLLNPVFSIAHMRNLLPTFYEVAGRLRTAIEARVADEPREVDMSEWMGRAALELIGQAGLGTSFDPLVEDSHDEYADALKALLATMLELAMFIPLIHVFEHFGPPSFRRWLLNLVPNASVQKLKNIVDTMHMRSLEIYRQRKAALEKGEDELASQTGNGKDIMSILIKANEEVSEEDRLPEDEVIAQISTITFGGTDTTSNALARILWLLATHKNAQQRLREEIIQAQSEQKDLPYDALMALPFLDAVCRETLRLYPLGMFISRAATQDMVLPLSEAIHTKKGRDLAEILVPKGTEIYVGITGWNTYKAAWGEDALEWKPERWLKPLPTAVTDAHVPGVYSNIMTFLGGGRACIGFKFSEMEMKVILATLLPRFTFELTDKQIFWNIAGVRYPSVGNYNGKSELPLKVGLYKADL